MNAGEEVGFFSALAEETSKIDESVGRFINEATRDPATIFRLCPDVLHNLAFSVTVRLQE